MARLRFPKPFAHDHPPVQNVNRIIEDQTTYGQRTADWVAAFVGSWRFIIEKRTGRGRPMNEEAQ